VTNQAGAARRRVYAGPVVPLLKFTVLRLALFVAALAALAALGAGLVVAVVGAGVVSMLLSYLLLRGPREALSRQIAEYSERRLSKHQPVASPDSQAEDAADDAQRAVRADVSADVEPDQHS
jgi:hypothetical protein